jgi:hypothetical protein
LQTVNRGVILDFSGLQSPKLVRYMPMHQPPEDVLRAELQ